MKNTFAQLQAQRFAAFNEMKANFSEEYYALRKCCADVIMGGKMKAVRKTRDGEFRVGVKVLDYPTLFVADCEAEYSFKMPELQEYFQSGHIKDLWHHQLDEAMKIAFKGVNIFLQQFE